MTVVCVPLPALSVVSLQLRAGSGPRCPHPALQAEGRRPHVADGGHAGRVRQKGDLLLLEEPHCPLRSKREASDLTMWFDRWWPLTAPCPFP